jgi:hypothetical protein
MSDLILNWRFGVWHFQIGRNAPHIRINKNQYHIDNPPACWFERY